MLQVEPIGLAKTWNSLEALTITDPVISGERSSMLWEEIVLGLSQGFRPIKVLVGS